MDKRVLVIGAGALGTLFAARLAAAGHDVALAVRDARRARRTPTQWTAIGPDGSRTTGGGSVVARPRDLAPVDVIILATKADDARPALRDWLPALGDGAVVPLQNGILGDRLADLAQDRLVECTVGIPATLLAPGRSEQTGPGELIVGPWPDARMSPATPLDAVASLLTDVAPTRVHQNMVGVKWTKLLINSAITGLGALTGRDMGHMLEDRRARTAFLHIITEGHRAGRDQGVRFERVNRFDPARFAIEKPRRGRIATRHAMLRIAARRYRRQRSSSLQSLHRGQKTEVDHLNGRIVEEATKGDRGAPVNAAVQAIVHDIEAGRITPSMDHLGKLPFRFQ